MVGCQVLSRPSAAEGGGRRPAFTGPATQPYSATEVGGWQQLSRVSQNRAAVHLPVRLTAQPRRSAACRCRIALQHIERGGLDAIAEQKLLGAREFLDRRH